MALCRLQESKFPLPPGAPAAGAVGSKCWQQCRSFPRSSICSPHTQVNKSLLHILPDLGSARSPRVDGSQGPMPRELHQQHFRGEQPSKPQGKVKQESPTTLGRQRFQRTVTTHRLKHRASLRHGEGLETRTHHVPGGAVRRQRDNQRTNQQQHSSRRHQTMRHLEIPTFEDRLSGISQHPGTAGSAAKVNKAL